MAMEHKEVNSRSELYIISARSRDELLEKLKAFEKCLDSQDTAAAFASGILSASVHKDAHCLSIVCLSQDELKKKLAYAIKKLTGAGCARIHERSGIYYFKDRLAQKGRLAFLFPGEGSQYQNMFRELALYFPEIRKSFEMADAACFPVDGFLPSRFVFPTQEKESAQEQELWKMEGAVESVVSANYAMLTLLKKLSLQPDCVVGHSSGEFTALEAAEVVRFDNDDERIHYIRRGYEVIKELTAQADIPEGILAAIGAVTRKDIESAIEKIPAPIFIAMENCPHQYVLCGARASIESMMRLLSKQGAICTLLPFHRPYHTEWFKNALMPLRNFFDRSKVFTPAIDIYSCAIAALYPTGLQEIRATATMQWAMPVRFQETIEKIYENGVRIFVEVGPRGNLCGFVGNILKDKAHIAVALDKSHVSSITQLNHGLGLLAAHGLEMDLAYYYRRMPLLLYKDTVAKEKKAEDNTAAMKLPRMNVKTEFVKEAAPLVLESKPRSGSHDMLLAPLKNASQGVFDSYFQTMESFVAIQADIMRGYLQEGALHQAAEAEANGQGAVSQTYPLIGEILEFRPRESLVAVREFNVEEDIFLEDHTFGTTISLLDPTLRALPILPLTVSIEILAEAASLLLPEKILIQMENIRASKWISFEKGRVCARITARYITGDDFEKVFVEIREVVSGHNEGDGFISPLLAEGTMVFSDMYPLPQRAETASYKNEVPCDYSGPEIYFKRLFHGPRFQGVKSIARWGEDGFCGSMQVLERTQLFRANPGPKFVVDPVLLDGLGSLLGIWAAREPWNGFVLFPFQVKEIRFFRSNIFEPGETFSFRLRIVSANETTLVSNTELVGENNEVLVRMQEWQDRNFYLTKPLHKSFLQAVEHTISEPLSVLEEKLSAKGKFTACIVEGFPEDFFQRHHAIWLKLVAFLIFNRQERQLWHELAGNEKSRVQYLLGRIAAKDAVRMYLKKYHGLTLGPADVVIENDESGRPVVSGAWIETIGSTPCVSISHAGMMVVACAGLGHYRGIGIDVEDKQSMNDVVSQEVFSEEEQRLASIAGPDNLMRLWCAKEAFSKALGVGMAHSLRDIVVKRLDAGTDTVRMESRHGWCKEFPFLEGKEVEAQAMVRGSFAIAACVI